MVFLLGFIKVSTSFYLLFPVSSLIGFAPCLHFLSHISSSSTIYVLIFPCETVPRRTPKMAHDKLFIHKEAYSTTKVKYESSDPP